MGVLRHFLQAEEVSVGADWPFHCCLCCFIMINYEFLAVICIFLPVYTWHQSPYPLPRVWFLPQTA